MAGKAVAGGAVSSAVSDDMWAAVERDWYDLTVDHLEIAESLGLTTTALKAVAKERGWPSRKKLHAKQAADKRKAKAALRRAKLRKATAGKEAQRQASTRKVGQRKAVAAKTKVSQALGEAPAPEIVSADQPEQRRVKKSAPKPIALLRHVCSTIEGELTKLDRQSGDTSQDRERASRALSQMVNSLEKTITMQNEVTKDTAKGSSKKQEEELAHADDLRRQIAERLERLQQKRASADGSAGVQ
jgi:hypothetical protein